MISIYLDVLLITNIYVNYFLLKSTAKLTHTNLKLFRCIIGSVVGSLTSLIILLPEINNVLLFVFKLLFAFIIIFVTFYKTTIKRLLKLTLIFFLINFAFAGITTLLYMTTNVKMLVVNNFSVYFDIPIIFFAVATIISYIIICLITHIIEKNFCIHKSYKVLVELQGIQYLFNAVCDSGNALSDSFSGRPVVICNSSQLMNALDIHADMLNSSSDYENYKNLMEKSQGFRLLPYSTVKGKGLIPVIKPDKLFIKDEKNHIKSVDAYIGLTENSSRESEAIFNPCLLI